MLSIRNRSMLIYAIYLSNLKTSIRTFDKEIIYSYMEIVTVY